MRDHRTGHNDSGKSCVAFDGPLPTGPVPHDRYVWTTDGARATQHPRADAAQVEHRLEPPADGSVFRLIEFPPQRVMADLTAEQKDAFFRDLFAGIDPSIAFNPIVSFQVVVMALLGGIALFYGPMLGVIPLVMAFEMLMKHFPNHFSVVLGIIFLLIVYVLPGGLLGLAGRLRRTGA